MENKFTKGNWNISDDTSECYLVKSDDGGLIASVYDGDIDDEAIHMDVVQANAKLIAAAPNMLDALLETDKDLCVLESTMAQIEANYPRAEGMTELVKKWRERNKLAINKATE